MITKYISQRKAEKKKKWRGDLTETVGAHERFGLLKLQARAVYINWRKGGVKLKMEIKIGNSHLRNNLIFSIFIKKKRDWEFCWPHCHSELKSLLGPWGKGENFLVFVWQYRRQLYIQLCACSQGAKKIIFTACPSGKLKLAFTSPDVISTSPKNVLFFCYSNSS